MQLALTMLIVFAAGQSYCAEVTTIYPCVDDYAQICRSSARFVAYCTKNPVARATCCHSCALKLGFTTKQQVTKLNHDNTVDVDYINVVDLSSPAAASWSALPKTNTIYPGLTREQTNQLCIQRGSRYGLKRFCRDKIARTICGSTCLEYNYPA